MYVSCGLEWCKDVETLFWGMQDSEMERGRKMKMKMKMKIKMKINVEMELDVSEGCEDVFNSL